jgi:hypothetical protein
LLKFQAWLLLKDYFVFHVLIVSFVSNINAKWQLPASPEWKTYINFRNIVIGVFFYLCFSRHDYDHISTVFCHSAFYKIILISGYIIGKTMLYLHNKTATGYNLKHFKYLWVILRGLECPGSLPCFLFIRSISEKSYKDM